MVDWGGVWSTYPHCRVYAAVEGNSAGSAVPVAELRPWPRGTSLEACVLAVEKINENKNKNNSEVKNSSSQEQVSQKLGVHPLPYC